MSSVEAGPWKYGRPYYSCQGYRSVLARPTQIQAANQNLQCRLPTVSQVASLADDLPFDGAFLFPDNPLAYVG